MDISDFESLKILHNNTPVDEFCGLTPTEIDHLLYEPFGEASILKFQTEIDDTTLDRIPFFRICEELLRIVQREGFIKLTPLGALQRKVLQELYAHRFILEEFIESGISKLTREEDSPALSTVHITTVLTRGLRKTNGKLKLTKQGEKFLEPGYRVEFLKRILQEFTSRFNWGYNDGYTEEPVGQLGWGFSLFLLDKFGDEERPLQFYADKFLRAFPPLLDFFPPIYSSTPETQFARCYGVRTFSRFLEWFGFAMIRGKRGALVDLDRMVERSDVMHKVFRFE